MIKHVVGDILTPNCTDCSVIICHQVNCKGVMGAGLAKQVRNAHPDVYLAYKEKCNAGMAHVGDAQFVSCLDGRHDYIIANVFGQDGYGRDKQHTDYAGLEAGFRKVAEAFPNDTIRIPMGIGCGLGGGDWGIVRDIIDRVFANQNVEIWTLP